MQNFSSIFEEIRCHDASLADKLAAYTDHLTEDMSSFARAYSSLVERLLCADAGSGALAQDAELPDFLLSDNEGNLVSSADLLKTGPLVVSFNRGHWCAYCRLELLALAEIYPDIRQLGAELVSITPDCAAPIGTFRKNFEIPFRILTDIDNGYALSCGLVVSLGKAIKDLYLSVGRDLSQFHGNDACFVPIPATYVIGTDARVVARLVDPDFRHRMAPGDILDYLKKIS